MKKVCLLSLLPALLLAALPLTAGCYRNTIQTVSIEIPQLPDQSVTDFIRANLLPLEAVLAVEPDGNRLIVTYDSEMMASKNAIFLIADMGFEANGYGPRADGPTELPDSLHTAPKSGMGAPGHPPQ